MTHNVWEHVCELFIPMLYIAYIGGELIARKFLLGCEKMSMYYLHCHCIVHELYINIKDRGEAAILT